MKIVIEYAAFLAMSVGAHVLVLAQPGANPGAAGADGGTQGVEVLTLAALPASMGDMVHAWTKPPEVMADTAPMHTAMLPDLPQMAAPAPQVAPQRPMALPALPAAPLTAPSLPQADLAPPAPPKPKAEPKPKVAQKPEATAKPAAKPAAKSDGRAAQVAKGTGSSDTASRKPSPKPTATVGTGQAKKLLATWAGQVRASVERNKRYPGGTRASGRVVLRLTVATNGRLQSVGVVKSSGDAALDQAALTAVKRAKFPGAPKGMTAGAHTFTLPISFSR